MIYYIIFVLPAVLFALFAQIHVSTTFKKFSKVASERGMTGADGARLVLGTCGLNGQVPIERVTGELTDHYDPKANVIRLSAGVYDARSAAAVGVAAHEAGHAAQYAGNYAPIRLRAAIIPVTKVGSYLSFPLICLGIFLSFEPLIKIGIVLFAFAVLFQLLTLPVELNASRRAVGALTSAGLSEEAVKAAKKVLVAAALTYVAALAVSIGNLIRLLLLANRRR